MIRKLLVLASVLLTSGVHAQPNAEFPDRAIRLVVAYGAGGSTDQIARALGVSLGRELGQPIVIENRPGASGLLAASSIARSEPDGYTLGVTAVGIFRVPHVQASQVDPMTELTYVSMINEFSLLIGVKSDAPWRNVRELIEEGKKKRGSLSFASPGMLSTQHLALSELGDVAGVEWTHVPYRGDAEAITATLGGFNQFVGASNTILPFVNNGQMRVLASMNASRLSEFPDVPTLKEEGYDVVGASSLGIIAPKGLEPAVLQKLEHAFKAAANDEAFLNAVKVLGVEPRYMNSEEYTRYARETYEESRELVHRYGKEGQ